MLQGEHSAILLTFIKLPFVIKIFVLSILECPFYTGFTVQRNFKRNTDGLFIMFICSVDRTENPNTEAIFFGVEG